MITRHRRSKSFRYTAVFYFTASIVLGLGGVIALHRAGEPLTTQLYWALGAVLIAIPLTPNGLPVIVLGPHRLRKVNTFGTSSVYFRNIRYITIKNRSLVIKSDSGKHRIDSNFEGVEYIIETILKNLPIKTKISYGSPKSKKKWSKLLKNNNYNS